MRKIAADLIKIRHQQAKLCKFANAKIFVIRIFTLSQLISYLNYAAWQRKKTASLDFASCLWGCWDKFSCSIDAAAATAACLHHRSCHFMRQLMFVELPTFAVACTKYLNEMRASDAIQIGTCDTYCRCKINYYPHYNFRLEFISNSTQQTTTTTAAMMTMLMAVAAVVAANCCYSMLISSVVVVVLVASWLSITHSFSRQVQSILLKTIYTSLSRPRECSLHFIPFERW